MSVSLRGDQTAEMATPAAERAEAAAVAAARRRRRRRHILGIQLVSLVLVLGLWQLVGSRIDPILFTTPSAVAAAAVEMVGSGELWAYLWPSLIVLVVGLAIASLAGIGMGLLLARFWMFEVAVGPYLTFLYATPAVALVPIIVLWAGFQFTAKIIVLFLFAFFPIAINTHQGVKNVSPELLEVGRAFRCSERQLWANIILPAALPFIVAGLRLAVGRGLIGMVLADLYTAISGIGYLIVRSASIYRVDKMFVPIIVLGLLGVGLTALIRLIELRVAPWTAASRRD